MFISRPCFLFFHSACAVAYDYIIDFGFVAIAFVETCFRFSYEVVVKLVFYKVYRAAAETAAHDTRAGYTAFTGNVVEEVEFFAANLVVFRQAVMCFVHSCAYGFVVAGDECVANVEHALFFFDYEFGTEVIFGCDITFCGIEHFHGRVAQGFDTKALGYAFAGCTALVVGRVGKFVFYYRVDQHKLMSFGVEGEVFILHRAAVEAHQMVFLAEHRGELVHNAAVYAAVVVFCRLADSCKFEFVDGVAVEQVVQGKSEAGFECGGGAESGAEGNVAGEYGVETFDRAAALDDFATNAEDVACP